MNQRLETIIEYLLDRMEESSTWQGVGFILAAIGCKFGVHLDWGQAAFVGGFVSGLIKSIFPDVFKKKS